KGIRPRLYATPAKPRPLQELCHGIGVKQFERAITDVQSSRPPFQRFEAAPGLAVFLRRRARGLAIWRLSRAPLVVQPCGERFEWIPLPLLGALFGRERIPEVP